MLTGDKHHKDGICPECEMPAVYCKMLGYWREHGLKPREVKCTG